MPGPAIVALHLADPPAPWEALGFAVGSEAVSRVGEVTLHFGGGGDGIAGWALSGPGEGSVAGIATEWRPPPVAAPTEHPNTAVSIDHVVLTAPDVDRTLGDLRAAGMVLRRERCAGSSHRPLRQAFFRHGEPILEVVGPARPEPEGQEVARPRLWGVTVTVADLNTAAALLGERLGGIRAAVQPGRRIATVRDSAGLSVPLALMSPAP